MAAESAMHRNAVHHGGHERHPRRGSFSQADPPMRQAVLEGRPIQLGPALAAIPLVSYARWPERDALAWISLAPLALLLARANGITRLPLAEDPPGSRPSPWADMDLADEERLTYCADVFYHRSHDSEAGQIALRHVAYRVDPSSAAHQLAAAVELGVLVLDRRSWRLQSTAAPIAACPCPADHRLLVQLMPPSGSYKLLA